MLSLSRYVSLFHSKTHLPWNVSWLRMQALINLCRKMTLKLNRGNFFMHGASCTYVLPIMIFTPAWILPFIVTEQLHQSHCQPKQASSFWKRFERESNNLSSRTALSYWYVHTGKHACTHVCTYPLLAGIYNYRLSVIN